MGGGYAAVILLTIYHAPDYIATLFSESLDVFKNLLNFFAKNSPVKGGGIRQLTVIADCSAVAVIVFFSVI